MGLLLGGFFVAVFHFLIQDKTIDFSSHLIAQFVFGVIGYLLVLPLAITAYFSSQQLINRKASSGIYKPIKCGTAKAWLSSNPLY